MLFFLLTFIFVLFVFLRVHTSVHACACTGSTLSSSEAAYLAFQTGLLLAWGFLSKLGCLACKPQRPA